MGRTFKLPTCDRPHMESFVIVRDGDRYGIAQYDVDVTQQHLMSYKVRHWYATASEATAAKQVLHDIFSKGKK